MIRVAVGEVILLMVFGRENIQCLILRMEFVFDLVFALLRLKMREREVRL